MSATILIVDDHVAMRKSLREWLAVMLPQCRVIEAASGEEAIDRANESQLVIMDIGLAGMSGIEATQRIKAIKPSTHVVILTVYEDEIHRADAMRAGASAYVLKRELETELLPALKSLLSGPEGGDAERSSMGRIGDR